MREIKLNLKQIFEKEKQPYFRAEYELSPEDLAIPADLGEIKDKVKVDVYIVKNPKGEGYKVMYNLKGNIDLTCSRCLEVYQKDLGGEHTIIAKQAGEREHLREGDLNVFNLQGDILNLTELVREQIILDIPYKPLCHPDCKGVEYNPQSQEEEKTKNTPFANLKNLLRE